MRKIPRTYQIPDDLLYRIDAVCLKRRVRPSHLVALLIDYTLTRLENGRLELETREMLNVIDSLVERS